MTLIHSETGSVFTRQQLTDAFHLVANRDNWKKPIDADVTYPTDMPRDMFETIVKEAVVFFTGSVPTFERFYGDKVRVQAIGYYLAIGA